MTQDSSTPAYTSDTSVTESLETVTQAARDAGVSRRNLLSTAAAGVGAMAFAGNVGALTQEGDSGGNGQGRSGGSGNGSGEGPSNVEVLNYALTLEHLENEFYRQGLEDFSASELRSAEVLCQRNEGLNADVPARIRAIGEHEAAHVETITKVVEDLGGDPVEAACYDFGYETPSDFLGVARVLENTGVSAYTGAIHFLDADELATAGATIATVEARHASFLNTLNQENPFPRAFDRVRSMEEVKEAAGQFIVECEG